MHIKKSLPNRSFTKMDNRIFVDPNLSDGAIRLYGFLASLPNGKTIVDKYIMKSMDISQRVLSRRKSELKEAGLIYMEQLAPRVYDLYIGYPDMPAKKVREHWRDDISDNSEDTGSLRSVN